MEGQGRIVKMEVVDYEVDEAQAESETDQRHDSEGHNQLDSNIMNGNQHPLCEEDEEMINQAQLQEEGNDIGLQQLESNPAAPKNDGGIWYQCKYCCIYLEDVMMFLFHIRLHDECPLSSSEELAPDILEKELGEASREILYPTILVQRLTLSDIENLSKMPSLFPAPPIPIQSNDDDLYEDVGMIESDEIKEGTEEDAAVAMAIHEETSKQCSLCSPPVTFSSHNGFVDHLFQNHRIDKEFRCSRKGCRYRTRSVQYLENHMNNHPLPFSRFYTCHLCTPKTNFFQSTKYARHMKTHLEKDGRYKCKECIYSTTGLQLFNKHMKKRHPNSVSFVRPSRPSHPRVLSTLFKRGEQRLFHCHFCSFAWYSRKEYESHMAMKHRNMRGTYNCNKCDYEGDTIRLIARHLKYKHIDNQLNTMPTLTISSNSQQDFAKSNNEEDNEVEIEDCEIFQEEEEEELNDSMEEEEEGLDEKDDLSDYNICPLCPTEILLGSPIVYFDHIFSNHVVDGEIFCTNDPCMYSSASLQDLLIHIENSHIQPEKEEIQIQQTQNGSNGVMNNIRKQKLNWIMKKGKQNQKEKTFHCFYCSYPNGVQFHNVRIYSSHMRSLHMDKNGLYSCPSCPSVPGTTLKRINEHMKRKGHQITANHSTPPKLIPAATNYTTSTSNIENIDCRPAVKELLQNEKRVNGRVQWFQCKICKILHNTKEKLFNHQRIHHTQSQPPPPPPATESVPPPPSLLQMPFFKCRLCTPVTWHRTSTKLDEHISQNHQRQEESSWDDHNSGTTTTVEEDVLPTKRQITCLFCFAVYTNQREYIDHMNSNHTDADGNFWCPKCLNFSTPLLAKATKHIRRHGNKTNVNNDIEPIVEEIEQMEEDTSQEEPPPQLFKPRPLSLKRTLSFPMLGKKKKKKRNSLGGFKHLYCRLCEPPSYFERQRDYMSHVKMTHGKDGVYPCNKCPDTSFLAISDVNKHMRNFHRIQ